MKKMKLIPFAISVIIIGVIIYFSNPYKIYENILGINKVYILIAFLVSIFNNAVLRILKWKVMLDKIKSRELFPIQMFGFMVSNLSPGKIAEPAKCIVLKMRKGVSVSVSLPTMIWERINDILAMLIISLVAIQALSIKSNIFLMTAISMGIFAALVAALLLTLYSRKFGNRIFSLLKKLPGTKSITREFIENFYSIKTSKTKIAKSFALTFVVWVLEGVTFYFVLMSMGIQSNFMVLAGIVCLSALVGVASSLPGGIGSSEFVMILLLGLTGVESIAAVSAVFILRIITFWFVNFMGAVSFLHLSKKLNMKEFKFS